MFIYPNILLIYTLHYHSPWTLKNLLESYKLIVLSTKQKENDATLQILPEIKAFNLTFRYIDDILLINNPNFANWFHY
jgi:hypothetical protein